MADPPQSPDNPVNPDPHPATVTAAPVVIEFGNPPNTKQTEEEFDKEGTGKFADGELERVIEMAKTNPDAVWAILKDKRGDFLPHIPGYWSTPCDREGSGRYYRQCTWNPCDPDGQTEETFNKLWENEPGYTINYIDKKNPENNASCTNFAKTVIPLGGLIKRLRSKHGTTWSQWQGDEEVLALSTKDENPKMNSGKGPDTVYRLFVEAGRPETIWERESQTSEESTSGPLSSGKTTQTKNQIKYFTDVGPPGGKTPPSPPWHMVGAGTATPAETGVTAADRGDAPGAPVGPMRKYWVHLAFLFALLVASLVVWIRTLPKTKTFAQVLGAANAHLQHTYSTTFRSS